MWTVPNYWKLPSYQRISRERQGASRGKANICLMMHCLQRLLTMRSFCIKQRQLLQETILSYTKCKYSTSTTLSSSSFRLLTEGLPLGFPSRSRWFFLRHEIPKRVWASSYLSLSSTRNHSSFHFSSCKSQDAQERDPKKYFMNLQLCL